jgi:hypothetical protein
MKDRTGEEIEPTGHDPATCPQRWERADGTPVFCTICRPHLSEEANRRQVHGFDPGGAA